MLYPLQNSRWGVLPLGCLTVFNLITILHITPSKAIELTESSSIAHELAFTQDLNAAKPQISTNKLSNRLPEDQLMTVPESSVNDFKAKLGESTNLQYKVEQKELELEGLFESIRGVMFKELKKSMKLNTLKNPSKLDLQQLGAFANAHQLSTKNRILWNNAVEAAQDDLKIARGQNGIWRKIRSMINRFFNHQKWLNDQLAEAVNEIRLNLEGKIPVPEQQAILRLGKMQASGMPVTKQQVKLAKLVSKNTKRAKKTGYYPTSLLPNSQLLIPVTVEDGSRVTHTKNYHRVSKLMEALSHLGEASHAPSYNPVDMVGVLHVLRGKNAWTTDEEHFVKELESLAKSERYQDMLSPSKFNSPSENAYQKLSKEKTMFRSKREYKKALEMLEIKISSTSKNLGLSDLHSKLRALTKGTDENLKSIGDSNQAQAIQLTKNERKRTDRLVRQYDEYSRLLEMCLSNLEEHPLFLNRLSGKKVAADSFQTMEAQALRVLQMRSASPMFSDSEKELLSLITSPGRQRDEPRFSFMVKAYESRMQRYSEDEKFRWIKSLINQQGLRTRFETHLTKEGELKNIFNEDKASLLKLYNEVIFFMSDFDKAAEEFFIREAELANKAQKSRGDLDPVDPIFYSVHTPDANDQHTLYIRLAHDIIHKLGKQTDSSTELAARFQVYKSQHFNFQQTFRLLLEAKTRTDGRLELVALEDMKQIEKLRPLLPDEKALLKALENKEFSKLSPRDPLIQSPIVEMGMIEEVKNSVSTRNTMHMTKEAIVEQILSLAKKLIPKLSDEKLTGSDINTLQRLTPAENLALERIVSRADGDWPQKEFSKFSEVLALLSEAIRRESPDAQIMKPMEFRAFVNRLQREQERSIEKSLHRLDKINLAIEQLKKAAFPQSQYKIHLRDSVDS